MNKITYQSIPDADKQQVELVRSGNMRRARAGSEASSSRGRGHYRTSNKSNGSTSTTSTRWRRKQQVRSKESQSNVKQVTSAAKNGRSVVYDEEEYSDDIFGSCFSSTVFESPYFYGPLVVFISLIAGICVYRINNGWPWTMCFYYAAQALVGDMYAVPGDETDNSKTFTLGYFIYGEFLLAATFAVLFDSLIESSKDIQLSERLKIISEKYYNRKRYQYDESYGNMIEKSCDSYYHHQDGTALTCTDIHDDTEAAVLSIENLLVYIDWPTYRKKYIYVATLIVWILIGVIYGYFMEGWDLSVSLYYAIGAISTAGVFPPNCIGGSDDYNCEMTALQATLAAIYVIIGVPLFEVTLIELVALLRVEQKIKAREKAAVENDLTRPLTQEDWQYGLNYLEIDANTVSSLKSNDLSDDDSDNHDKENECNIRSNTSEENELKPIRRKDSEHSYHEMHLPSTTTTATTFMCKGAENEDKSHLYKNDGNSGSNYIESGRNDSNRDKLTPPSVNDGIGSAYDQLDDLYDMSNQPLKKVPSTLEDHVEKVSSKVFYNGDSGSSSSSSADSSSSVEAKEHRRKEVVDLVEGKGEIEIPRRSTMRNKKRQKKNVWQQQQQQSGGFVREEHGLSHDNSSGTSRDDHLGLMNTTERTISYNSISASKDSKDSVNLLSSNQFDNDDCNDNEHANIDDYDHPYDGYASNDNNSNNDNDVSDNDFIDEDEDVSPTAEDYNDFVLHNSNNYAQQESKISSFLDYFHNREYGHDVSSGYIGGSPRGRIMFNLAQRDSSIDLRDTRVDDPVEGEYEL